MLDFRLRPSGSPVKVTALAGAGSALAQLKARGLRGQVPRPRPAHPPRRHRVQPRDADPRGVRGGVGMKPPRER